MIGAIAVLIARPTTDCRPERKGISEPTEVARYVAYPVGEAAAALAMAVQAPLFGDEEASDSADISSAFDEPSSLDNLLSAISRTHDAPFTPAEMASLAKFMRGDVPKIADSGLSFSSAGGNALASVGGRPLNSLTHGRSGAGGSGGSPSGGGGGGAPQGLPKSVPQEVHPNVDAPGDAPIAPGIGDVPNTLPPSILADDNPPAQTPPAQTPDNNGDEPAWNPPADQPFFPPVAIAPPPDPNVSLGSGNGAELPTTIETPAYPPTDFPGVLADENVGPHHPPMAVTLPPVGVEAVPEPATFAVWAGLSLAASCFAWRKCHR